MTRTRAGRTPGTGLAQGAPTLIGIDHVELWVGNARQAAHFWASALGFRIDAYAGPETGVRDRASYVCSAGDVRVVLTGAVRPGSELSEHHARHGDTVRDVAFTVTDAREAYRRLMARGATGASPPGVIRDPHGVLVRASVSTYGEVVHSLIERRAYGGGFLPGYEPWDGPQPSGPPVGPLAFDHVVGNVERGRMARWVEHYRAVWGFREMVRFDESQISTEHSALRSTVVTDDRAVVLPINEPADGLRPSQIDEYLQHHLGPGVQHIAFASGDIVTTVRAMRSRGVRFLEVPDTYYADLRVRIADLDVDVDAVAELGILVDRDADGHLLQIFTEPIGDRPTLFLEVIQRAGSRGFGEGNFKALFEAIERAQDRRGNL